MNRDVRTVLADPGVRRWCEENGLEPAPSTPEEFARYMAEETELLRTLNLYGSQQ